VINNIEIIDTLLFLSRPAADPARTATFGRLATRAAAVVAAYREMRDDYADAAEVLAQLDLKVLQPKLTTAAWPLVGRVSQAGTALRDHLDAPLADLRNAVRACRASLVGPEHLFVAAAQALEKAVEREEHTAKHVESLVAVAEKALAALTGSQFLSTEYTVPTPLNIPGPNTVPAATTSSAAAATA
jgi:hypothetical protein